ncbi:hypothetical protein [Sphingobium chungbukense]|uniref:hypothetical protein n=1 Tax=Sphingobium chungbukense TaxID=56193 RepID=UPI0012EE5AFD|nr:hypothetical protein [Sphingobium chungbukense]
MIAGKNPAPAATIGKLCAWDGRRGKGKNGVIAIKAVNRGKIGTDGAAFNDAVPQAQK